MPEKPTAIPAGIDPAAPAEEHLDIVWRGTRGSRLMKAGRLAVELLSITLGLQSGDSVQPTGVDIRWRGGELIISYDYGEDVEGARRHTTVLQRRLSACSVAEFLALLRDPRADRECSPKAA
jgi:hypothetical protein